MIKNNRDKILPGLIFLLFLILLPVESVLALGILKGQVTDAESGEGLPGVNIIIKGTYLGAATDIDGYYNIAGIKAGSFDLQASFVGYKVALKTNVIIKDNQTQTIDFALESTVLAIGQEVVVIGERPLIDVDQTATSRTMDSEEISGLAVEGVDDILEKQVGVVKENNEIHIRGGRADENLYIIDNLSVKDPISGQGLGIYLSADAIDKLEVITGGFNAEYGEAMSGLVNVETKEGNDDFSGSLSLKTDNLGGWPEGHQNTNNGEFSFSGPELITRDLFPSIGINLPGDITFFLNGYGYISDTHLPHSPVDLVPYKEAFDPFAMREENNWSSLAKLTWKISPVIKLSYSYGRSLRINQGYFDPIVEDKKYFPLEFMNILDKYNTVTREGIQQTWNLTHTLSSKTFYELTFGSFYNRVHSASGRKHYTEYEEPIDLYPINYEQSETGEIVIKYGDGLWDSGNGDLYHDHYNDTYQLKYKITSQVHQKHQVKMGFEFDHSHVQMLNIHEPWIASTELGGDYDMYDASTQSGAFFAQDKIEFKGMIANIGIRLDWWAPGKYVEDAINDPDVITLTDEARQIFHDETIGILGRRIKYHLSPRLGISHPVTDSDVLFFSYGHFSQRPKYAYVFSKLKTYSPSTYQLFGNPNLNPQTTVAYEMGVKHRFSGNQVIELVAFYKDLFDYATSFNVKSTDIRLGNISFYQYFNVDYARVRGIELRFRARQGRYVTGTAEFAYQIATGKSSSANAEIQAAANTSVGEKTLGEEYLKWDKPITASMTLWFKIPEGEEPYILGYRLPSHLGASLRWDIQSGKRYTPAVLINQGQDIQDAGDKYSEISQMWNTLDLKIWKNFFLKNNVSLNIFFEVNNIFNYQIPNQVNALTGEPYREGDPHPRDWENDQGYVILDPSDWKASRQMFMGIGIKF